MRGSVTRSRHACQQVDAGTTRARVGAIDRPVQLQRVMVEPRLTRRICEPADRFFPRCHHTSIRMVQRNAAVMAHVVRRQGQPNMVTLWANVPYLIARVQWLWVCCHADMLYDCKSLRSL
jgi:hypothetical protein